MSQRITITLPDDVYKKVKESAERDFRTIGAEIAYLLHLHVPEYHDTTLDENQITPRSFIPTPENPTGRPTLTNDITDTTAYYKKTII